MTKPTEQALRAARRFVPFMPTQRLAEIIDIETNLSALLKALEDALPLIDDAYHKAKRDFDDAPHVAEAFKRQSDSIRALLASKKEAK